MRSYTRGALPARYFISDSQERSFYRGKPKLPLIGGKAGRPADSPFSYRDLENGNGNGDENKLASRERNDKLPESVRSEYIVSYGNISPVLTRSPYR